VTGSDNQLKDRVAVAGVATTGFTPHNTDRSAASLAAEACTAVLRGCGLRPRDIDGVCGSIPSAPAVQTMLGLPEVTWFANPPVPFGNHVVAAASAIRSGLCDVVLCYHVSYRMAWNTASALRDPFRRPFGAGGAGAAGPETIAGAAAYAAWASRYLHEYGAPREHLGYVALNGRANALRNPVAAMRTPLSMDDYLQARMIREPLCLLDMDVPVDGADAFVLTSVERARDLPHPPVLVHAATLGIASDHEEDQMRSLSRTGQHVVIDALRARSDLWIDDVDVYFPYDGFTIITLAWLEATGWCGRGEAGAFLEQHWDANEGRALINRRIPMNPHGGALSEGATQGSGQVREAVMQLQGFAGDRQVPRARVALITAGGFFTNAQGILLRRE
jgi:acetyl-CoA acetyltransferase